MMEPTILHCAGACLDAAHDAAVMFLDHQGARMRFLDGVDLAKVSAAQLGLDSLHERFRISEPSLLGRYGRAHPDDTPLFAMLAQITLRCGARFPVGSARNGKCSPATFSGRLGRRPPPRACG